ncbi:MAG: ATP-binding protein [Chloroflexi bacterium]|jgi:predicted AAA+ superfamily ATPase|nr:ATP-binding protein [Chloroflexota bacterium]
MIKRNLYLKQIRPFYNTPMVKVLTGIRRSGKSTMLFLVQEDLKSSGVNENQFFRLNMEAVEGMALKDSDDLLGMLTSFFSSLVEGEKGYVFLDEVQLLSGWERVVNACNTSYNADIYITGSNASLLSSDLATYLSGRYIEFQIYPFSFSEFTELFSGLQKAPLELFIDYLTFGGMPSLQYLGLQYEPSMQLLRDIYNTIILKDVVFYGQVRDVDLLQRLILFVFDNIGNTFSATSINKYFKSENRSVTVDTVLSYLSLCEDAFLLKRVPRRDLPGKKLLSVNEKYFVVDHGFRESLLGGNQSSIQGVLENIVYWELKRRGFSVTIGKFSEKEIDFVATRNAEVQYYQVAYLLADENTIRREFGAFSGLVDNFGKFVLSMDQINLSREGIQHFNIVDWLTRNG